MWATSVVHTDGSLRWQRCLLGSSSREVSVDSAGVKCLCEWERFSQAGERLASLPPGLVFLGGSSFHHLSYHLIRRCARQPLKVIVFDRHTDCLPAPAGHVSCGSWIREIVKVREVESVLIVGPSPKEALLGPEDREGCAGRTLNPLQAKPLSGVHWVPPSLARRELARLCTPNSRVYVSIDKDVLADVDTDWGAGTLRLTALLDLLGRICRRAKLVGVDVCGELVPHGPWPSVLEWAQIRRNEEVNMAIWRVCFLGPRGRRSPSRRVSSLRAHRVLQQPGSRRQLDQ